LISLPLAVARHGQARMTKKTELRLIAKPSSPHKGEVKHGRG